MPKTSNKTTIDSLIKLLKAKDPGDREEAAHKLGEMGAVANKAVPALIKALDDEDCWVPAIAAVALGKIGPSAKKAVPSLVAYLANASPQAHPKVITALSRFGAMALPELKKAFENDNTDQRINVVQILGQMDRSSKCIIALLHDAVKDDHSLVRIAAVEALAQKGEEAVDELIIALEDKHSLVRTKSAQALGDLGPAAKKALDSLKRMDRDRVKEVKHAALIAAQAIES